MKSTIIVSGALAFSMVAVGLGFAYTPNHSPAINYEAAGLNPEESFVSQQYVTAIQTTFPDANGTPLLSAAVCMGKSLSTNMPEDEAKMLREMAIVSVKAARQPWPVAKASIASLLPADGDKQAMAAIASRLNDLAKSCNASKWHMNTAVIL